MRQSHSRFYCTALQAWETELKSSRQQTTAAAIEVDFNNAKTAWNWAARHGQAELVSQGVDSLGIFLEWRGRYQEGQALYQAVTRELAGTSQPDPPTTRILARLHIWHSVFSWYSGDLEETEALLQEAGQLLDAPESALKDTSSEQAFLYYQMGRLYWGASPKEAIRWSQQSLALYRELGDLLGYGQCAFPDR